MNSERWQQIKQLYNLALELEPARREAFLAEACAGDESLRKEIERLLAQHSEAENVLGTPALEFAARALAQDQKDQPQPDLAARGAPGNGKDDRFGRIEQIYHQALERPEDERPDFLAGACAGDEDLRKEVEKLLSFERKAGKFMESPALDVAAQALARHAERGMSVDFVGQTLLHYKVTEKIGEGGMGVVYKARDTHLDRTVAIKVLPTGAVADPERKRRFIQEAKAASALNHPGIVQIYDINSDAGVDFIAMEYVAGKTLDRRIGRKGLRIGEALKYGVQIADALAAAHAAGIVHRDLKPANIMVTETGLVKVLDFGLAKLTQRIKREDSATASLSESLTEAGRIMGTVAYMSPEQAEGKAVDARSDIFSFGSVLYEMLSGKRAFQKDSTVSTLSAIIEKDPSPLSGDIPPFLERIVVRCLHKDPARRFQAMADVKVELEELRAESESGRLQVEPAVAKRVSPFRLAVAVFAVFVCIAAGWYWLGRRRSAEPAAVLTPVPLTSYPGYEGTPSFNPDGTQVAFEWCTDDSGRNCDIWIKQIGVEPPFRLTTDPAADRSPAWSPDGSLIAFLRWVSPTKAALIIIPQRGGQERVLGETNLSDLIWGPCLAWTPDSKWLAFSDRTGRGLFLLSVQTRERRRLTDKWKDKYPAFSPDGRALAFQGVAGDIKVLRLAEGYLPQGLPERLTSSDDEDCAAAWTSDGSEILFSKNLWIGGGLWRMAASASANPRKLPLASEDYGRWPAISRHGSRLAYTVDRRDLNIWRVEMREPGLEPGVPSPFISSSKVDYMPSYSPDGRKIVFTSTRSGAHEIWVCRSDGSNAVQLTRVGNAGAAKWSPDGRTIVYREAGAAYTSAYVISAEGGAPRRLTTGPFRDKAATFSRDGKSIYFVSDRSGMYKIWKVPPSGGDLVQVTPNGESRDVPEESPDGKFLYYNKGWPNPSLWRMPVGGGEETLVLDSVHEAGQWAFWKEGIYFFKPADEKGRSDICLYELATGKTRKVLTVEKPVHYYIGASPDGRMILYTQLDQSGRDLMLVENFR